MGIDLLQLLIRELILGVLLGNLPKIGSRSSEELQLVLLDLELSDSLAGFADLDVGQRAAVERLEVGRVVLEDLIAVLEDLSVVCEL